MDNSEKEILETLKNFDTKYLLTKDSYVEINLQGNCYQAFILGLKSNDNFEIYISRNTQGDASLNMLSFFGENLLSKEYYFRKNILNHDIEEYKQQPKNLKLILLRKLGYFNIKLDSYKKSNQNKKNYRGTSSNIEKDFCVVDKNGKNIKVNGYQLYQFLTGEVLDAFYIIRSKLSTGNIDEANQELFLTILNIIKYLIYEVKNNLNKYKNAYFNRKLLIVSKIHAILVSFEPIIANLTTIVHYNYDNIREIEFEFIQICNSVYDLILSVKDKNLIPWPCMKVLMEFILNEGVHDKRIQNYKNSDLYTKFNVILENLSEVEIKNIRKNSDMKEICRYFIDELYGPSNEILFTKSYNCFLISCLKSQNLETKMNALNDISEIINSIKNANKTHHTLFRDFIIKNNILDMIFAEGIHDEIIKRSYNLFTYFAQNNLLDDKIIEKIIERENNDLMKKLLIKIITVFPKEKKDNLFLRLSKGIKFNNKSNKDIEFIAELTEACLNKSNEQNIKDKNALNNNGGNNANGIDEKNYYGLNMIFDYIIKDFDDKIKYEENNVDFAIDAFKNTIFKVFYLNQLKEEEIFIFLEKLLDNIKSNEKHNSVVQSLKLFKYLMDMIKGKQNSEKEIINLKNMDKKYNIIPLLIEDLMRYMSLVPNDFSEEKIYEGIYPHNINIEQRLKLIFYFPKKSTNNYGLEISGKKYIEKVYNIFNTEKYKNELKRFYEIFSCSLDEIDEKILSDFFSNVLQNKSSFDLKNINDKESINFIIKIFKTININKKSIYYDRRNIRVEGSLPILGFDLLFDLLTQNGNNEVQNKISEILCSICIYFKDYTKEDIIQSYWKKYYSKIMTYLDSISKSHDKIAFNGIIKLLNKIYSFTSNYEGKIMKKGEYHTPQSDYKYYKFEVIEKRQGYKNDFRLRAGNNDTILELRYKLSYYFDIPVNNVAFIGLDNKMYTLNNDFDLFVKVFNDQRYFGERQIPIKVKNEHFQFLKMKENPRDFIEKNENLYNILIEHLKLDNKNGLNDIDIESKQKIWNIISKLPKNYFFVNKLKQFGEADKENIKNAMTEIFNIKEVYLLTYTLQCLSFYLFENKDEIISQKDKNNYLDNFINKNSGEHYILNALLNMQINKDNCIPIDIECISIIINILQELQKNKITKEKLEKTLAKENIYELILTNLTETISQLLELNYTKYKTYLNQFNDEEKASNNSSDDNDEKENINNTIAKLIENILNFIEEISKGKNPYMLYMFKNIKLFTKIFVVDYIQSEADESRKVLEDYLTKNYGKNNEYIKKYLEIILTVEVFNYLVKNNSSWKYFHVISSIMKKYEENLNRSSALGEKENKNELQYYKQSKQIIDIILDYIQNECEKNVKTEEELDEKEAKLSMKNNENFKEGILIFLTDLIKLNQKELVPYILKKVDIFDLFINKCLLRKCIEKPLEAKDPFCLTRQSQNPVYNLIIIILKNIHDDELYNRIINFLNRFHEKGFWKTFNHKNWELDSKEMIKGKYIGLQNMSATCYLNSIIQQLYMIPMLRETILKINNSSKNNILYELQLLFSALKIYEFAYYDPRSFVVANKLNFYEQMDADEFYGTLIDKIENDIKSIYGENPNQIKNQNSITVNDLVPKDGKNSKNENYKYKNIFNYFFGIEVLDELKFVDCNHKRHNKFFYNNIQLEIKSFDNIYDSLKNYFKTEVMDGDNKINCEICKIKRNCHKHLIFKSLPNIFVIILKRFEFDYNTMLKYKLNKYFEFPFKLDMKDYLIENHNEINTEYELTGITIHYGVADFGHYYDLIKGPDGKWYKFNDISVSEFKEEDIPKEAYGEKEIFDEDSSKEKESGKNNAYILFYRKTDFNQSHIDKNMKSELALPPYNKYSNINDELKKEINFKLYKSWTMKNIASPLYQNFVISLIKFDITKIKGLIINPKFLSLCRLLKQEKYINDDIMINNNFTNGSFDIFQFALKYYFSVYLRISKRCRDDTMDEIFKQMIRVYLLTDINRAKFLLEEFSNNEVIEEYLIYCPNTESIKICLTLLIETFQYVYEEISQDKNDTFTICFLNTYIVFIDANITQIAIEAIRHLFISMLEIGESRFKEYLKRKKYDNWVRSFYVSERKVTKTIINADIFPVIKSDHCILSEKNNNNKKLLKEDTDLYEQQFLKNLNDNRPNTNLIQKLGNIFGFD